MDFKEKITELRKQNHFTQKFVAEKLGITVSSYFQYETGRARPEYEKLVKLADLYDVTTDYLLGREEYNKIK